MPVVPTFRSERQARLVRGFAARPGPSPGRALQRAGQKIKETADRKQEQDEALELGRLQNRVMDELGTRQLKSQQAKPDDARATFSEGLDELKTKIQSEATFSLNLEKIGNFFDRRAIVGKTDLLAFGIKRAEGELRGQFERTEDALSKEYASTRSPARRKAIFEAYTDAALTAKRGSIDPNAGQLFELRQQNFKSKSTVIEVNQLASAARFNVKDSEALVKRLSDTKQFTELNAEDRETLKKQMVSQVQVARENQVSIENLNLRRSKEATATAYMQNAKAVFAGIEDGSMTMGELRQRLAASAFDPVHPGIETSVYNQAAGMLNGKDTIVSVPEAALAAAEIARGDLRESARDKLKRLRKYQSQLSSEDFKTRVNEIIDLDTDKGRRKSQAAKDGEKTLLSILYGVGDFSRDKIDADKQQQIGRMRYRYLQLLDSGLTSPEAQLLLSEQFLRTDNAFDDILSQGALDTLRKEGFDVGGMDVDSLDFEALNKKLTALHGKVGSQRWANMERSIRTLSGQSGIAPRIREHISDLKLQIDLEKKRGR